MESNGHSTATTQSTYWLLYHRLLSLSPFVYTRYGDGEYELMLDGYAEFQSADPELSRDLRRLYNYRSDGNLIATCMHEPEEGMRPGLFLPWVNPRYDEFRQPYHYQNAIALHAVSVFRPHILRSMMDMVRSRRKVYVGSQDGPNIRRLIGDYDFVRVPERNAYQTRDEWMPHVKERLAEAGLAMLAMGPAKCVVANMVLDEMPDAQVLDLGSVADFALGIRSHRWIKIAQRDYPVAREAMLSGV